MTGQAKCDYPGCDEITIHYDSTFKKWECANHQFDKVIWPKLSEPEAKLNETMVIARATGLRDAKRSVRTKLLKPSKWGKRYF
jgi:hypothetical protein